MPMRWKTPMILRLMISVFFPLLVGLTVLPDALSSEAPRKRRDENKQPSVRTTWNDPLPRMAVARLGGTRLRQSDEVVSIAYSPNGKYIASAGYFSSGVYLWDAATGEEIHRILPPRPPGFQRALFSPSGRYLIYRAQDEYGLHKWDLFAKRASPMPINLWPIAISPNGELAAGVNNRSFLIYDLNKRATRFEHRDGILTSCLSAVIFSPDGKFIVTAEGRKGSPSFLRLWNVANGKQLANWMADEGSTESLSFSPEGKFLASGGRNGVHLWEVATRRSLATFESAGSTTTFSPDGKLLATGGYYSKANEIHLWDPATHKLVRSLPTGAGKIRSFVFSPDGKMLLAGGRWHSLQLWDVETGRLLLPVSGHEHTVFSLQFSPDGKTLASYGDDLAVRLWNLETKKEQRRLVLGRQTMIDLGSGDMVPACSLAFSPDGKSLAVIGLPKYGEADNPVHLWDVASGKDIAVILTPRPKSAGYRPTAIAFSPDGHALATVNGGRIQLWSPVSAAELRLLPGDGRYPFLSVVFSPDGRTLAASQLYPRQIVLWDLIGGRSLRTFPCQTAGATCIAYSPDGHLLAASSSRMRQHISQSDKTIQLHETASGTLFRTLSAEETSAACIAFSRDGRLLASAGQHDHTVRIWDVFTGKELAKFTGHRGPVYCVAFSPDGKTVASGSADTTILLWDVSKLQPEQPPSVAPNDLPNELPRLWEQMQAKEGAKAYQAIWHLLGAGDDAVAFVGRKLHPVPAPDAKLVQQCIADLDSDDFAKRETANEQLKKLRQLAEPALRQALQGKPSLEARKRLESLLADLAERSIPDTELRQIRALHALELLGSPTACDVLKKLAGGAAGARLTRDAKLALQRLERRLAKP